MCMRLKIRDVIPNVIDYDYRAGSDVVNCLAILAKAP